MANPVRPPLRSSTERRTRHTKSPATDEVENNTLDTIHVSTRRSSRGAPLVALDDEKSKKAAKTLPTHPPKPATLARTPSRKRPATALTADATADARPPTKVTVTQPHGELLRITNGVPQALGIGQDDVPSGVSTPRTNGAAAGLTAPEPTAQSQDKRSLRSHDGGSRLKSDLAIYFSNYDDIIAGVPKSPGMPLKRGVARPLPNRSRAHRPRYAHLYHRRTLQEPRPPRTRTKIGQPEPITQIESTNSAPESFYHFPTSFAIFHPFPSPRLLHNITAPSQ